MKKLGLFLVGEHTPIFLHELTKEDIQEWVDRDEEII